MLPSREPIPKYVVCQELAKVKFDECIKNIIGKLCAEFQNYMFYSKEKKNAEKPEIGKFTDYLQLSGIYQEYMANLLKNVVIYVNEHFDVNNIQKTNKQFDVRKYMFRKFS